jgi:WhiB family redox-sensing transcriptional regulator
METLEELFAIPADAAWQHDARCALIDPAPFLDEHRQAEAAAICERCPVQAACLEYALEHDERFGIWGGLSPRERARLRRRRK